MIKVAEAISDMNIGGAGRLLLDRIEHSDKSRFSYTVILPKGSALVSCFKKIGVKTVEIQGCYDKSLDFKSLYRFYRAIKNISPNILNSHACINARIAGRLARVDANIYTRHCDFPIRKMYTLSVVRRFLGVAFDILNNGVIAVSDSARKNLLKLGVSDSKIKVIINGAQRLRRISNEEKSNLKRRLNIPPDSIVVSIFARLEEYKDHKTFLRAAKRLMLCDKYYFLIVGDGALADELKKYASRLNIEPKVRFLGFVDDVSPIMNITDVNVNCSIGTETSSLALSEGMSLGVPAIASDYEGNKYIVKNGVNGLIFSQRNDRELARKILYLTRNEKLYSSCSKNAIKRFNNELNAKRMAAETEKYYIDLLKKKTARQK